jgi:sulfatase maturation enzyme AslB (radical SAM superfamily)
MSPEEYLKSDFLRQMKQDMVDGKVPPNCVKCEHRESRGLKSTRQAFFREARQEIIPSDFTVDSKQPITRAEFRVSNLCNFKCRMCNADSSIEIKRENELYPVINKYNPDNIKNDSDVTETNFESLKNIPSEHLRSVCFTGGEPMLIKQYYDYMDFLIEKGYNEKITLELFTNCSVYNPKFVERMLKFDGVRFVMSIDGVGKTAEYIRHGTDWKTVSANMLRYVVMPKTIFFNTAISSYTLLDLSAMADFLLQLRDLNDTIADKCYTTVTPTPLHFINMPTALRARAVEQIDIAVDKLSYDNFAVFTKELRDIKTQLLATQPNNPRLFVEYTAILDKVRGESFEDVFGYKLY